MFENIINQSAVPYILEDVQNQKVPHSILFAGPENSAKMTTALELARVMSCEQHGEWTCACKSCIGMRAMSNVDFLILGSRDLTSEIKASAETFLKVQSAGSHFLFSRAVKKLLIRFDPRLWDSDETRFIKASPLVYDTSQLLNEVQTMLEKENTDKLRSTVDKIIELTDKIQNTCMYETIPVNQVRKATSWIRLAPTGRFKFLIIENAEKMQESARAAFLKILEEPPQYAFFILTTTRQAAIMQTILSRVRRYTFLARDAETERQIVTRVFHDELPSHFDSDKILNQYFQKFLPVAFEQIKAAALDFWNCTFRNYAAPDCRKLSTIKNFIERQNTDEVKTISQIINSLDKGKNPAVFKILLEQIVAVLQVVLNTENNFTALEIEDIHKTSNIILKWKNANSIYNLSEQAILESIAMEITAL